MNGSIDELEQDLLRLEHRVRARLAHALLESLDALSDDERERLWVEEAERRAVELRADPSIGRSLDDVIAAVRAGEFRR
jgi:hypothetical protein